MNISPVSLQSTGAFNKATFKANTARPQIMFSGTEQPEETKQEKLFGFKKFILPLLFLSAAFPTVSAIKGCQATKAESIPNIKSDITPGDLVPDSIKTILKGFGLDIDNDKDIKVNEITGMTDDNVLARLVINGQKLSVAFDQTKLSNGLTIRTLDFLPNPDNMTILNFSEVINKNNKCVEYSLSLLDLEGNQDIKIIHSVTNEDHPGFSNVDVVKYFESLIQKIQNTPSEK